MSISEIRVMRIGENGAHAYLPEFKTPGAMACDLYAAEPADIAPGATVKIGFGLAFEPPPGFGLILNLRSGSATENIALANEQGWIDPDYRGEVSIAIRNHDPENHFPISRGDRIGQMRLVPVHRSRFVEVQALTPTARGAGGYGSTGKR